MKGWDKNLTGRREKKVDIEKGFVEKKRQKAIEAKGLTL